jgi:hypothetical protein
LTTAVDGEAHEWSVGQFAAVKHALTQKRRSWMNVPPEIHEKAEKPTSIS